MTATSGPGGSGLLELLLGVGGVRLDAAARSSMAVTVASLTAHKLWC